MFENYGREASQLELEIERKGIALGIDWSDEAAVAALARDALDYKPGAVPVDYEDPQQFARLELYGLADLMLKVMAESAGEHIATHGGTAWKALGSALWREWQARQKAKG
jgi:hypothetical protein